MLRFGPTGDQIRGGVSARANDTSAAGIAGGGASVAMGDGHTALCSGGK